MLSNAPNFAFIPNVFVGGNFAPFVSVQYSLIYLIPMLFRAELRLRQVLNAVHDRRYSRHCPSTQDLLHSWARTQSDTSTEAFRTPWAADDLPDHLEYCPRTKAFVVFLYMYFASHCVRWNILGCRLPDFGWVQTTFASWGLAHPQPLPCATYHAASRHAQSLLIFQEIDFGKHSPT